MLQSNRQANESFSRRTASDVLSFRPSAHTREISSSNNDASSWTRGPFDAVEEETGSLGLRPVAMSRTVSARFATEPLNLVLSDLRRPVAPVFGPSQGRTPSPLAIPEEAAASPFAQSSEDTDAEMTEVNAEIERVLDGLPPALFTGSEAICGESAERWRVLGRCWKDHLNHCESGRGNEPPSTGFA